MIRSMTGFGAAVGGVGGTRVAVEIRSVNHRFFTPSIKLPAAFARWEAEVREALRTRIARGHVTLFARIEDSAERAGAVIDETRFAAYVAQLRILQARHGLSGIDAGAILRLPDVLSTEREESSGSVDELVAIVEQAAADHTEMRTAEGARLVTYLEERLAEIERALARISDRAPQRLLDQRDRMRANVLELTQGVGVDEQRIAQEIAILADRLDVNEELSRFASHLEGFRQALGSGDREGVGKRLGFLLQEMLREANTTGSKGNDTAIVRDVIVIKEEIERIREQVENLE